MKKNVMMRMASCLLVAVLLTTCIISGTFAKYTSVATGSDTARVAKWDIKFGNDKISWGNPATGDTKRTFTFDLFNTVYDSNGTDTETDVATGTNEAIIAPGTSGNFSIVLTNASEVNAKYTVTLREDITGANDLPIKYSLDKTNWTDDITQLTSNDNITMTGDTSTATVTVYWTWIFNVNDTQNTADTTLGLTAANSNITVTVTADVTVEQVD